MLILGDAEIHGSELREPPRRAVLTAAATDAIETLGFVAYADLFQLDPRAEEGR